VCDRVRYLRTYIYEVNVCATRSMWICIRFPETDIVYGNSSEEFLSSENLLYSQRESAAEKISILSSYLMGSGGADKKAKRCEKHQYSKLIWVSQSVTWRHSSENNENKNFSKPKASDLTTFFRKSAT